MYTVKCQNDVGVKWEKNFVRYEDAEKYKNYQESKAGVTVILIDTKDFVEEE